jgi:hypothetical protein
MITVWVTTQFEALHHWPEAPEAVGFLKFPHRHLFHVKLETKVCSRYRELEFFTLKDQLNTIIRTLFPDKNTVHSYSCEEFAQQILDEFLRSKAPARTAKVTVSEDGENGAAVEYP